MFLIACFVGMFEHEDRGAGATHICGWFPSIHFRRLSTNIQFLSDCFVYAFVVEIASAAANRSSSCQDSVAIFFSTVVGHP